MRSVSANAHIVILTGAGISRESGIETFRDTDGIWQRYSLEDVCTPDGFLRDPALVHAFYNDRRKQLADQAVKPNAAHIALAELQQRWPGKITLVTQNIDDLHERGGSRNVLHMHGELMRAKCNVCLQSQPVDGETGTESVCFSCQAVGWVRPDIVWFGEMPYEMERIHAALEDADMFVAIGTSGTVYPAAGFCHYAAQHGAMTVEINLEPSAQAGYFSQGFYGPATEQVPLFVASLFSDFSPVTRVDHVEKT
jgi:NAD-dependent deacetylase